MNRNFLWGSTPEKRKMYIVNWDKLNWKLFTGENSPWARVLRAKYLSNRSASSPWSSKGSCFRTWAACKASKPLLDKGLRKVITSGSSSPLWNDNCSSKGNLRSILSDPLRKRTTGLASISMLMEIAGKAFSSFSPNHVWMLLMPSPSIPPPLMMILQHGLQPKMEISL